MPSLRGTVGAAASSDLRGRASDVPSQTGACAARAMSAGPAPGDAASLSPRSAMSAKHRRMASGPTGTTEGSGPPGRASGPRPATEPRGPPRRSRFGVGGRPPYDAPVPLVTPIDATDDQLARVKYDANGLVPAIVQDRETGQVLMMAWMNDETLRLSLAEGRTVFWSRSRKEVWRKGETSGDVQHVRGAYYDCDGDTLLFVVDQQGAGACHTGERSCFFRAFGPETPA